MPNNDTLLFQNLLQQIETLNKEIKNLKTPTKAVYTNKEMLELLDISTVTLKKWRNRGYNFLCPENIRRHKVHLVAYHLATFAPHIALETVVGVFVTDVVGAHKKLLGIDLDGYCD